MDKTLIDELKSNKLKKTDYDNLTLFFNSYYGGKAVGRKEYNILDTYMNEILKNKDDFISNIIQGIKSYPNDKYILSERLERFLKYLSKEYKFEYRENSFENFKIKDKTERLLMMLKYLHSGDKSRSDIAEDFGVSERTVADDLSVLQNGFGFLGTELNIANLERGNNKYSSLIHPVFLALNSAEIYSMTVGLKLLSKGTVFEESLGRIANTVYEQLSENAKEKIDKHKDDTVSFDNDDMKFINSYELKRIQDSPFAYFLKEPIECVVNYYNNGEYVQYQGKLDLAEASIGNVFNKIILKNDEMSIVLDIENIVGIKEPTNFN